MAYNQNIEIGKRARLGEVVEELRRSYNSFVAVEFNHNTLHTVKKFGKCEDTKYRGDFNGQLNYIRSRVALTGDYVTNIFVAHDKETAIAFDIIDENGNSY